jgi:hypothetical protein
MLHKKEKHPVSSFAGAIRGVSGCDRTLEYFVFAVNEHTTGLYRCQGKKKTVSSPTESLFRTLKPSTRSETVFFLRNCSNFVDYTLPLKSLSMAK